MRWLKRVKTVRSKGKRVLAVMNQDRPVYIEGSIRRTYPFGVGEGPDGPSLVSVNQPVGWAEDLTGNNNHARSQNRSERPTLVKEGENQFLRFDGEDDYLEIPYHPSLDISGNRSLTVEVWARCPKEDWGTYWAVVSKYNQFILGSFRLHDYERLAFIIHNGSSWRPSGYNDKDWGQAGIDHRQWHHYAGVYDYGQSRVYLYVDGQVEASYSTGNEVIAYDESPIHIGHRENDPIGENHGNVELQDLRIWSTARSQSQINANMNIRMTGKEPGLVGYWPL